MDTPAGRGRGDRARPRLDSTTSANRVQVVEYRDITFTKTPAVLRGIGLTQTDTRPAALQELPR